MDLCYALIFCWGFPSQSTSFYAWFTPRRIWCYIGLALEIELANKRSMSILRRVLRTWHLHIGSARFRHQLWPPLQITFAILYMSCLETAKIDLAIVTIISRQRYASTFTAFCLAQDLLVRLTPPCRSYSSSYIIQNLLNIMPLIHWKPRPEGGEWGGFIERIEAHDSASAIWRLIIEPDHYPKAELGRDKRNRG